MSLNQARHLVSACHHDTTRYIYHGMPSCHHVMWSSRHAIVPYLHVIVSYRRVIVSDRHVSIIILTCHHLIFLVSPCHHAKSCRHVFISCQHIASSHRVIIPGSSLSPALVSFSTYDMKPVRTRQPPPALACLAVRLTMPCPSGLPCSALPCLALPCLALPRTTPMGDGRDHQYGPCLPWPFALNRRVFYFYFFLDLFFIAVYWCYYLEMLDLEKFDAVKRRLQLL